MRKGQGHSKEALRKMSVAGKDRKHSEVTRNKISFANSGSNHPLGFKGKKHSKETLNKMSIAKMGRKHSKGAKRKISESHLGKRHSKETIIKMSGANHPNWQGGIAAEPYCDAWLDKDYKDDIKERDNNTCQNPDCRQNCNHLPLTIHHIDHVKKNCLPQNLITLCCSCNSRANFNREYWTKFYQGIINLESSV